MTNDNLNLLTMLTNKAIPTHPDRPIEISEIEDQSSWQYDTLSYTSIWSDGQALPLTLRRYQDALSYWQIPDTKKADRVWAALRRLRLDAYPSPRPLARGEFGKSQFLIWHRAPGEMWDTEAQNFVARAKALIPQLADILARLHILDHNGLNYEPLYQATVAGSLVRMLLWSRETGNEDLRQVIARLKPAAAQIRAWPHKLVHGNPHLGNVTVEDGQITALHNWENAAIGDPRWDVMTAAHWLHQYDTELADQLINWYETFASAAITDRPFWYAMVAARLWALKSYLRHAIQSKKASRRYAGWTKDLSTVKKKAFRYLEEAGL